MMSDYTRLEISGVVYECMNKTELRDKDREMVETMLEICDGMRDQDFRTEIKTYQPLQQTGSKSMKMRSSKAAMVCLVLLCFLLLTAVIVMSFRINTNCTQDTSIAKLIEERDQLLAKIKAFELEEEHKNQTQTNEKKELSKNDDQIKQCEQLQQEKTDLQKCFNKLDGWFYYQSRFYFISSEKKNWTESRGYCRDRGADLIIINNKQEQDYLTKISAGTPVWIGLTDNDEEGRWKWVDGTNIANGFRFWGPLEFSGGKKENCAVSFSSGWADYPCHHTFQWICKNSTLKSQ